MYNGIKFPIPYSLIQAAIGGHLARLQEGGTAGNPSELGSPLSAPPPPAPPVLFPGEEPPEDDPIRISTNLAGVTEDLKEATERSPLFSGSIQKKLADAIEERNRNRAAAAAESARIQAGIRARAAEAPTSSPQFLSSGVQGGSTPTGSTTSSLLQKAFLGEISDFLPPVIEERNEQEQAKKAEEFELFKREREGELQRQELLREKLFKGPTLNLLVPPSLLPPGFEDSQEDLQHFQREEAKIFGDQSPSSAGRFEIPVPGFLEGPEVPPEGTLESEPQPGDQVPLLREKEPFPLPLNPPDPPLDVKNNLVGPEGQNLLAQAAAAADEKFSSFHPLHPNFNVAGVNIPGFGPADKLPTTLGKQHESIRETQGSTDKPPEGVDPNIPLPGSGILPTFLQQIIKDLFSKNTGIQGAPLTAPPGGVQLAQAQTPTTQPGLPFIQGSKLLPSPGTTTSPTTPFTGRLTDPAIAARFDQKSLPILGPGGRNIVPPGGLAFTGVGPSTPEQRQLAALKEAQKTFDQTSLTGGGGPLLTQAQRARTFAKSGGLLRHLTKTQPSHPLLRKV